MSKIAPFYLSLLLFVSSCVKQQTSSSLMSLQMIDRNGQTETISVKQRLEQLEKMDYCKPQPYEKILRVYSKNDEGKNPSIITTYHKNGQLFQHLNALDGRAFGEYTEYYENGCLKIKANVIEGTADLSDLAQSSWVFEGPCQVFYPSGNLQAEFFYSKGKKSGMANYFFESGQKMRSCFFNDDLADGDISFYDKEGNILEINQYKMGKHNGRSYAKSSSGEPIYEEIWENDELIDGSYFNLKGELISEVKNGSGQKSVFIDGKLNSKITFQNGKIEGLIQEFDAKGNLKSYYHLKDTEKEGEEVIFYPFSHQKKLSINWAEGAITGMVKTYYKNGTIESQKSFLSNKKNGPSTIFYDDGSIMMIETYQQDKLKEGQYFKKGEKVPYSTIEDGCGIACLFDEWGSIKQEILYEKGQIMNQDP